MGAMSADASIGIAGCKVLYPDGTLQHGGGAVINARGDSTHLGWHEPDHGQCDAPFDADFVTGAALGVTRVVLQRIGPLDEGFTPAYYEDVDWCYRARAAGYCVRYVPEATLVHHESASSVHMTGLAMSLFHKNRVRFVLKHWPAGKLVSEFLPQETVWLGELGPGGEQLVVAMRRAYLDDLLDLDELARLREQLGVMSDVGELASLLVRLREACTTLRFWTTPTDPTASRRDQILDALHASWMLKEPPFHSNAPLVGPAIAGLRDAVNNISTRWYVLPMAQQQTEYNANVLTALAALDAALNHLATMHHQEVMELMQELSTLAERLQTLERRLNQGGECGRGNEH